MKIRKRVASLLAVVMVVSLLAACSSNNNSQPTDKAAPNSSQGANSSEGAEEITPGTMPIVKEPINVKVFTGKPPSSTDWNEVMMWKEYEKLTNIHIEWSPQVPFANLSEKVNITMASGDYPEVMYASMFTSADMLRYGSEGVFLPLNDLIEKYAPNIKKMFDENPSIRKGATMADGNIYSIPTIVEPDYMSVRQGGRMWYKKEWLDQLGLTEPQTPEDFYNLLKTVKEKDPAGGGKTDAYSGFLGFDQLITYLSGAWGLNNRGLHNYEFDVNPETGDLRYIPIDPKYKEVLELVNKMYKEGLLGDILESDLGKVISELMKGNYFAGYSQDPVKSFNLEGYVAAPALTGPYGDKMYTGVTSPILWSGDFILTKNAKHPKEMIQWIDYLYGDEGSKLFFMGVEGKTYEKSADGTFKYVDEILNPAEGITFDQAVSKYLTWPGGGYAGVVRKAYFLGSESSPASLEATEKVAPYFPKDIWAPFSFTAEENEIIASIGNDITTYVAEMKTKFLTGVADFSEWDKYVTKLNKMGLEEYLQVYKDAYQRYQQ